MAEQDIALLSLNAGECSRFALARIDLAKLKAATETQTNFLPTVLGPTFMRPGTGLQDHTKSDLGAQLLEFVYDATTKALLVCTPLVMRVMVDGVYVTRGSVATAVTNGTFPTNLASWTDSDEAGAASTVEFGRQRRCSAPARTTPSAISKSASPGRTQTKSTRCGSW
jgi:hypothetical protein